MNSLFFPPAIPTPAPLTKDQAIQNLPSAVRGTSMNTVRLLVATQREGINQVWHHPLLTPQEAVDSLGTNAGKIFQAHGALTNMIVFLASLESPPITPDILLPTNAFTSNEDGTITVLDGPYVP